jgi:hypothetical protein
VLIIIKIQGTAFLVKKNRICVAHSFHAFLIFWLTTKSSSSVVVKYHKTLFFITYKYRDPFDFLFAELSMSDVVNGFIVYCMICLMMQA